MSESMLGGWNRRQFLGAMGAGSGALAMPGWLRALDGAPARPPNIVLILADDLGYECLGANGGPSYRTPVLDRLPASGVRFTHCYAQPLCMPTRVQLMTGLSNVRNYIRFGEMDRQATTFANLLKAAGYATCMAGKWQPGQEADLPRRFGLDEYALRQHLRRPPRYANPRLEINGVEKDFKSGEYGPDLVNAFALDFITRKKSGPFLLYYPMILTHAPYQPTPDSKDWVPGAQGEGVNQTPGHFADMVAYMDKLVGRLVARLEAEGILDNTLLRFLGDNGTGRGVRSMMGDPGPVRGAGPDGRLPRRRAGRGRLTPAKRTGSVQRRSTGGIRSSQGTASAVLTSTPLTATIRP